MNLPCIGFQHMRLMSNAGHFLFRVALDESFFVGGMQAGIKKRMQGLGSWQQK